MTKKFLAILIAVVVSNAAHSQNFSVENMQQYLQAPNAVGLGTFGKYDVSHYTGQANVEIAFKPFSYRSIDIPIKIRYNTSGNKVNEHPGCVGLGWTLEAGGSIVRIVNGSPDEISKQEITLQTGYTPSLEQGYYYRANELYKTDAWEKPETINNYVWNYFDTDAEPDEFVFNFCGIAGSFYLNGLGVGTKNASTTSDLVVDIIPELCISGEDLSAFTSTAGPEALLRSEGNNMLKLYRYFKKFTVVLTNGDRYTFGGDASAIDYTSVISGHKDFKSLAGQPTSWHLTKIERADGAVVDFTYEKNGDPFVASQSYRFFGYSNGAGGGAVTPFDQRNVDGLVFQHPSYLSEIKSSDSKVWVKFNYGRSTQLGYDLTYDQSESIRLFINKDTKIDPTIVTASNFWMQLNNLEYYNNDYYSLEYSFDPSQRLRLLNIYQGPLKTTTLYSFKYNTTYLPRYFERKTDNWGYYNGETYTTNHIQCVTSECINELYNRRKSNIAFAQAEMLERITYPTGGYSTFTYELNDYSNFVQTFPSIKLLPENGYGAGLRISRIVSNANRPDSKPITTTYKYLNFDGSSSGILSGKPTYSVIGKLHEHYHESGWSSLVYYSYNADVKYTYYLSAENNVSSLQSSQGRITYSRVEVESETNGKEVYSYSNYNSILDAEPNFAYTNGDDLLYFDAVTSMELERGKLLSKESMNNSGKRVHLLRNNYNRDTTRFSQHLRAFRGDKLSLGNTKLSRYNTYKIYTYHPYLQSTREVSYYEKGDSSAIETIFTYNSNRMVSDVKTNDLTNNTINMQEYRYVDDVFKYVGQPYNYGYRTLALMKNKNIISTPIEVIKYKIINGKKYIVGSHVSEYMTFPLNSETVRQKGVFELASDTPLLESSYTKASVIPTQGPPMILDPHMQRMVTYDDYDSFGNLLQFHRKDNVNTSYAWGYDKRYPTAKAINVPSGSWLHESFEEGGFNSERQETTVAKTGVGSTKACVMDWGNSKTITLEAGRTYKLSFWAKRGTTAENARVVVATGGQGIADLILITPTNGGWIYGQQEFKIPVGQSGVCTVSILSGGWGEGYNLSLYNYIDDIRIAPVDAQVESYTWDPGVGMTSKTDPMGLTTTYEYDGLGRLIRVRDSEGKVIQEHRYKYATEQ